MRHIVGSSDPDVIIGSDKDRNRRCTKIDKDHTEFVCELFEAQVARGLYFVHELTSQLNSRVKCVDEDHGHAGNENNIGGSVHVWVGCM